MRVIEADRQADVVLRADGRATIRRALARLPIDRAPAGGVVALGAVADVELGPLRAEIAHEDGVRTVAVRLDVRGRSLEAVAHDVASAVAATAAAGRRLRRGGRRVRGGGRGARAARSASARWRCSASSCCW